MSRAGSSTRAVKCPECEENSLFFVRFDRDAAGHYKMVLRCDSCGGLFAAAWLIAKWGDDERPPLEIVP